MSRLTIQEVADRYEDSYKRIETYGRFMNRLVKDHELNPIDIATYEEYKQIAEWLKELQHYKDLEEQGRLIDWRKTSEEKPDSTRHLIVAYGEIISHYGYYLKPKDKWFTDWTCEKEMDAPMFWADMPDPPEESLHGDCGAKMDEVENER
jgi:hypothetical protein